MKVVIQVEDPRGKNLSPMDEKTVTTECTIELDLWCDHITVSEENSDMDSEGARVAILPLILEFIECINPEARPEGSKHDTFASRAEETLPHLLRLQRVLSAANRSVDASIGRYLLLIQQAEKAHEQRCDEANLKHRKELNAALAKQRKQERKGKSK